MIEKYIVPVAYLFLSYMLIRVGLHARSIASIAAKDVENIKASAIILISLGLFDAYLSVISLVYFNGILTESVALTYSFIGLVISMGFIVISILRIIFSGFKFEILSFAVVISVALFALSLIIETDPATKRGIMTASGLTMSIIGSITTSIFLASRLRNIKSSDEFLRASAMGGLISLVGFLLTLLFFVLNRLYGYLFGPLALMSQAFMAVGAIGIYMSISPPDFLLKWARSKVTGE